jgi:hypothetical protein
VNRNDSPQKSSAWHVAAIATWGAVLLVVAVAIQPLLGPPPRGHDALLHYYRIPVVSELWRNGIIFARWAPDLVYGYGSPLFNFYPPLSAYLLAGLYWLVEQNGPLAYSLSYALALLLSAVSMFLLGRRLFGVDGGLLACAVYVWSPQLLLQTYSRGSLSNALALAFVPLAAWALLRVGEWPNGRRIAMAAVSVALVLLSHAAAGLLFMPILFLLGLGGSLILYRSRPWPLLAAFLLGLAMAAWSWLPGLVELGATRYAESVEGGGAIFADHFAAVFAWPEQTIAGLAKTPLPHSAGLVQLLVGAGGVVLAAAQWRRHPLSSARRAAALAALAGLVGLGVLLLTTPAAAWLWERSEQLRQIQFPWRLLDVPAFLLVLPVAWWAAALHPRWRAGLLAAVLALAFLNAAPYLYPARLAALPRQPTLADVTEVQQQAGIVGLTAWGEYSSAAVEAWPAGPAFPGADRGAPLHRKLIVPEGVAIRSASGGLLAASWELFLPAPRTVAFAVHTFPGWRAELDGLRLPISTGEKGAMQLRLPAGRHELALSWARTPVRWLADGLSLLALLVVSLSALVGARRRPANNAALPGNAVPAVALLWPLALLAGLLLLKVAILDTRNTPLVVHPNPEQIPGTTRPEAGNFGVFRLLGYEMEEPCLLALYWYAPDRVERRYSVRVTLADALGVPVKEIDNVYPGDNPTTSWEAGMYIRDVYRLPLDERPAPVAYTVSVAVIDPETGEPLPLQDGPPGATTTGAGRLKRAPEPVMLPVEAQTADALFGEAIELVEVQLPASAERGEPLTLTLFWASRVTVEQDFTVFVHLLRPDGEFIAAFDAPPLSGLYPTSFWAPGETIVDTHELQLDVPPGSYLLQVGLYELASGVRLPLSGAPAEFADRLTLGSVTVYE